MPVFQQRTAISAWNAALGTGTFLLLLGVSATCARADLLSGSAELDATFSSSKSTDATGAVSSSHGSEFLQRYSLATELHPYPQVRLFGGGQIKYQTSSATSQGSTTDASDTTFNPYVDLLMGNSALQMGGGYSRSTDTQTSSGSPSSKTGQEEYHGILNWKPEGLPSLMVRASHQNQLAGSADQGTDQLSVGTSYQYKTLSTHYNFTGTDTYDNTDHTQNTEYAHSLMASYSNNFFNQRVSLFTSYNASLTQSNTKAGGGGTVDTTVSANSAISNFSPDSTAGTAAFNPPNPYLIDGINDAITNPIVNLGKLPDGSLDINSKWSIGVGFDSPRQVNTLQVYIYDKQRPLPPSIWRSFSWEIYVRDSDTAQWSSAGTPSSVTFDSFNNIFRIEFPVRTTQYIKLVVAPLSQAVALANKSFDNPDKIFVTELKALLNQPAAEVQGGMTRSNQGANLELRTRLWDAPALYHSLHLSLTSSSGGQLSYLVSNTLDMQHRINKIFSAGAMVGREDNKSGVSSSTAYTYSATLSARPLSTLGHTLVYSGKVDQSSEGATTNSVYLTNTAQIYQGVSLNLATGYSSVAIKGATSESVQLTVSGSVVPRSDLSFSVSYNSNTGRSSGVPNASSNQNAAFAINSTSSKNGNFSLNYRPFSNLYLVGSYGVQSSSGSKTIYVQSYGANWSPFADGDLQVGFNLNQDYSSVNRAKTTSIVPSLTWKVMKMATLDLSYARLQSESTLGTSTSEYISSILRIAF